MVDKKEISVDFVEVSGCWECPFMEFDTEGIRDPACDQREDEDGESLTYAIFDDDPPPPPDDCPLRKGQMTIPAKVVTLAE